MPVFSGERLVFWSINRSHQSDIGGATHGAYNPGATEIWQEGIRIPPLKLYDAGRLREDVLQMIATNVRHPRDFRGDLAAMIGSARVGERRMQALLAEYGAAPRSAAMEGVLDGAERQARACIAGWQDGVYRGEAVLDDDGHGVRGRLDPRQGHQARQRPRPWTCPTRTRRSRASSTPRTRTCARPWCMALAYLIDPETPKNDGAFRPLTVMAQAGHGGLGEAAAPRSRSAPTIAAGDHGGGHQGAGPGLSRARHGRLGPALPDRHPGQDPRTGSPSSGTCSRRGRAAAPRPPATAGRRPGEWQAAGGIKFGSLEVTEVRFPLFFRRHEFRPDSGGDGRFRGGPGVDAELVVEIAEPARANTAGDGVRHGACGIFGGEDGLPHRYVLRSAAGPTAC